MSQKTENFLNQDESKYIYIYSDRREIRIDLILSNQEESQRRMRVKFNINIKSPTQRIDMTIITDNYRIITTDNY